MTARCFVEPADWSDAEIRLSPGESHHLVHVLRARTGDRVVAFDGRGREAEAQLVSGSRDGAVLKVLGTARREKPAFDIVLAQALIKGPGMDWLVQKATEIGASAIVPIEAARSVARLKGNQREERRERWSKIVRNAAAQCGTAWMPKVLPAAKLDVFLSGETAGGLVLLCALGEGVRSLKTVLSENPDTKRVTVLVGPEGDFTDEEKRMAADAGAVPVSLGSHTLRAETAGIFALSALVYELGLRA